MGEHLIAAELCIYNEAKTIGRLLESLKLGELVDFAIIIDGPIPGYPGPASSDDGTVEIIESFKNTILVTMPAREYFKRELACHICRNTGCQFILIIDGDEFIVRSNVEKFRIHLEKVRDSGTDRNIFGVNYQMGLWDQFSSRPRIWYKPWEVEYIRGSHWRFKNMFHNKYYDPALQADSWNETFEEIAIKHDSESRGVYREALMKKVQDEATEPYERSINFDNIEEELNI